LTFSSTESKTAAWYWAWLRQKLRVFLRFTEPLFLFRHPVIIQLVIFFMMVRTMVVILMILNLCHWTRCLSQWYLLYHDS